MPSVKTGHRPDAQGRLAPLLLKRGAVGRASSNGTELSARVLGRFFPQRMAAAMHQPIFFIGSGRSGSNLLARIMSSHPALSVFPSEANDLWHPKLYPWAESNVEIPPTGAGGRVFAETTLQTAQPADDTIGGPTG